MDGEFVPELTFENDDFLATCVFLAFPSFFLDDMMRPRSLALVHTRRVRALTVSPTLACPSTRVTACRSRQPRVNPKTPKPSALGAFFAMPPRSKFVKVPHEKLFTSTPQPSMFGNPPNPVQDKRGWSALNWLTSKFHFSFAEYSSRNDSFGVLRVMNDDLVQPNRGFGEHGHANMEICTYVVDGELTHKDSLGTAETLGRGAIQFMTSGKGVRHSEHNLDGSKPLRFIQMWITPDAGGLVPNYGSHLTTKQDRLNRWCDAVGPVAGSGAHAGTAPVQIHADCVIRVAELEPGIALRLQCAAKRQAYLLCVEGDVGVTEHGETLTRHDAAELSAGADITLVAGTKGAHMLVVEMAERRGSGRDDL